jgi:hypothetical protein
MQEFPWPLCSLRRAVIEYQPLLLWCFDCMRHRASHPLESLMSREI